MVCTSGIGHGPSRTSGRVRSPRYPEQPPQPSVPTTNPTPYRTMIQSLRNNSDDPTTRNCYPMKMRLAVLLFVTSAAFSQTSLDHVLSELAAVRDFKEAAISPDG